MSSAIRSIDHAIVGVRDLVEAHQRFSRLGFTLSPRGRHIGRGTANYCIMFAQDYLDLRGIVDTTQFTDELDIFLRHGEGLAGIVFGTTDAEACRTAMQAAGISVDPPLAVRRIIEMPDEEVTLEFKNLHLHTDQTPGLHTVVGQHLTLSLLRRAEWLSHANGAHAIAEVAVLVDDATALEGAYRHVFGNDAVSVAKGALSITFAQGRVTVCTPAEFRERHFDVALDETRALPRMTALTLKVRDPRATALYLSGQSIAYQQEPDGTVLVPPARRPAACCWSSLAPVSSRLAYPTCCARKVSVRWRASDAASSR